MTGRTTSPGTGPAPSAIERASPDFPVTWFSHRIMVAGLTDVGRRRSENQDRFGIRDDLGLILVADGMGGHGGGAMASAMAVEEIFRFVESNVPRQESTEAADRGEERSGAPMAEGVGLGPRRGWPPAVTTVPAVVQAAVERASQAINEVNRARQLADGIGMGTTLVGIWILEHANRCAVFCVGDSRLYRLRQGALAQLTRDHTAYQTWIDDGRPGSAPRKNVITRALGPKPHAQADIGIEELMKDDVFLLCSDGLTGMVDDELIKETLRAHADPESACRRLVALANEKGGADNVTAVVARCVA